MAQDGRKSKRGREAEAQWRKGTGAQGPEWSTEEGTEGEDGPPHRSRVLLWKRWGRGQDSTSGEGEGMAGVTGIEPATFGFGIRCST